MNASDISVDTYSYYIYVIKIDERKYLKKHNF